MRQIKFRGQDLDGKMRYGFYAEDYGYPYIIENHTWHEVKPESIAQLVGYDSNGVEVYEGDTLIDAYGNQYEVQFYPMGVNDDDCINLADSAKLNLTLKED